MPANLPPTPLHFRGVWRGLVGGLTLRSGEMQDVAVLPEHVHLLHARDRLHVQLLERTL